LKEEVIRRKMLVGTLYPGGGISVSGWPNQFPNASKNERAKRGKILNASPRSLQRASFLIQNYETVWGVMITLTFRSAPTDGRRSFLKWLRGCPWRKIKCAAWGWFREYQSRGVVHYHVILERGLLEKAYFPCAVVVAKVGAGKRVRSVVRGKAEHDIVTRWIKAVGDSSAEFAAFQWGGIVELLKNVDSPGRYLGAYAGKASQKQLPKGEVIHGRWWWMSKGVRLVPRGTFVLWDWPLDYPSSVIWDYRVLAPGGGIQDPSRSPT